MPCGGGGLSTSTTLTYIPTEQNHFCLYGFAAASFPPSSHLFHFMGEERLSLLSQSSQGAVAPRAPFSNKHQYLWYSAIGVAQRSKVSFRLISASRRHQVSFEPVSGTFGLVFWAVEVIASLAVYCTGQAFLPPFSPPPLPPPTPFDDAIGPCCNNKKHSNVFSHA